MRPIACAVFCLVGLLAFACRAAAQLSSTVTATITRSDVTNGVMTVTYDLAAPAGSEPGRITIALEVTVLGGATIRATNVSGDVGPDQTLGAGKRILWNLARDVEVLQVDRLTPRVVVVGTVPRPAPPPGVTFLASPVFGSLVHGKTVRVTTSDGKQQKGIVTGQNQNEMIVGGVPLAYARVQKVEKVTNRLAIGILLGVGGGFAPAAACAELYDWSGSDTPKCMLIWESIGAAGGAAVGYWWASKNVIFDARKQSTTIALVPIVSPTRKGVTMAITWR